jgi:adenosyl cobinamide kinase/adenosyl cobinamide phosphate guanylyltransferase
VLDALYEVKAIDDEEPARTAEHADQEPDAWTALRQELDTRTR